MAVDAERKADAYRKILLGGLLIKAGLAEQDKAVLLGGLLELAKQLQHPTEVSRLKRLGDAAFSVAQGVVR
jgi:Conjugal transfer protein TraD